MKLTVSQIYESRLKSGQITDDPPQRAVIAKLDDLLSKLTATKKGFFGFGSTVVPKGLYIWGGVGSGKSMLMDIFADVATECDITTARLHFHDFMVAVHDKVHDPQFSKKTDPARHVARAITDGATLICFDEMEVRDIADAMIIARVMEGFFAYGGVLVATSNRPPDGLYLQGLHRERFLPFIELLKDKTAQHEIEGKTDWRQRLLRGMPSWFTPDDQESRDKMAEIFARLTHDSPPRPITVTVAGRQITVDHGACNIGMISFNALCRQPLAARDYITLADRFSGLFIFDIPMMDESLQNESRRFMWLVDAFYDRGRFLVCSADSPIEKIYSGDQWAHEFPRTISRLTEMTKI